jgi:hypothetical protein
MAGGGLWMWGFYLAMSLACMVPMLLLLINGPSDDFAGILETWQSLLAFAWFAMIGNECAFTLVRESWNLVPAASIPPYNLDEFIVTRAVNRRTHFRIKTMICLLTTTAPLVVILGLSFLLPEYTHPGGVHVVSRNGTQIQVPEIALWPKGTPSGTVIFAVWMIWAATAALVLAQGYFGLVARFLSGRRPKAATLGAYLPVALGVLAMVFILPGTIASNHFPFLKAFGIFCRHSLLAIAALAALALVVQRSCERTFSKQEIW